MNGRSGATPLRCPHCGAHLPDEKRICPRCGKSPDSAPSARRAKKGEEVRPAQASPLNKICSWVLSPRYTPSRRAYRDRRRRFRLCRLARTASILLAAVLIAVLAIVSIGRLFRSPAAPDQGASLPTVQPTHAPDPAPTPAPTAVPAQPVWQSVDTLPMPDYIVKATPAPAPAPQATTDLDAATLPPAAEPSPAPTPVATERAYLDVSALPTPSGDADEAQPRSVTDRESLIDLYWYMIRTGTQVVDLDRLTVSHSVMAETADKFSNYFTAFGYSASPARVAVSFKAGLIALHAIREYTFYELEEEYRRVALGAMAALAKMLQPDMTELDKEIAIHDYIAENCRYEDNEALYTGDARGFFLNGACQCSGYADTFRLMATLAGIETEMIGGPTTRDEPGTKGHAWNLVRLDGLWYVVDVTWDDMIAHTGEVEHTFVNLPQTAFGSTRSWDSGCLPQGQYAQAVDDKYYYHRQQYMAESEEKAVELATAQTALKKKAYIYSETGDYSRAVVSALKEIHGGCGHQELSEDLTFDLYAFMVK